MCKWTNVNNGQINQMNHIEWTNEQTKYSKGQHVGNVDVQMNDWTKFSNDQINIKMIQVNKKNQMKKMQKWKKMNKTKKMINMNKTVKINKMPK